MKMYALALIWRRATGNNCDAIFSFQLEQSRNSWMQISRISVVLRIRRAYVLDNIWKIEHDTGSVIFRRESNWLHSKAIGRKSLAPILCYL